MFLWGLYILTQENLSVYGVVYLFTHHDSVGTKVLVYPLLFGMALIQNTWPKTSSINIQFGMSWKCRDASVLLVRSLNLRIFLSASSTWSSCEMMLKWTLEVLLRIYSKSPSILNLPNMKPCRATILWEFSMHLMNVSTLPLLQYSVV